MQNSNIKYILSYLIIIVFFILDGLFFRQSFIALLIIFLIILPIISIFIINKIQNHINIHIIAKTSSININNKVLINVNIKNNSIFPILNANIHFNVCNLYYPNQEKSIASLAIIPKIDNIINLSFHASHCGIVEISFDSLYITDYLHFHTIKVPIKKTIQIPVFPNETNQKWNYTIPESFDDDDEHFVPFGSSTHDLKETREYQPGDLLKNIHWKLSSKTDNLTVKVFETSADRAILLLPELNIENLDKTIETLYNFSLFLINQKEFFKILIFSASNKSFEEIIIENDDDITRALLSLYHVESYEMHQYALNSYYELYEKYIINILAETMTLMEKDNVISTLTKREDN